MSLGEHGVHTPVLHLIDKLPDQIEIFASKLETGCDTLQELACW